MYIWTHIARVSVRYICDLLDKSKNLKHDFDFWNHRQIELGLPRGVCKEFTQSRRRFSLLLFLFCQRGCGEDKCGRVTSQPQNCRKSVGSFQSQFVVSLTLSLILSLHRFISLVQKLLYFDSRQTNVRIEIKREAATGSSEWKTWRKRTAQAAEETDALAAALRPVQ